MAIRPQGKEWPNPAAVQRGGIALYSEAQQRLMIRRCINDLAKQRRDDFAARQPRLRANRPANAILRPSPCFARGCSASVVLAARPERAFLVVVVALAAEGIHVDPA
jgi:hypothetical protein